MPRYSPAFKFFRTCYRHPAGQVGVAVTDWLLELGMVMPAPGGYQVSNSGLVMLYSLGARNSRLTTRLTYRFCIDYTEKRPHVAGDLGAALTQWLLSRGWASRSSEGGRPLQRPKQGLAG